MLVFYDLGELVSHTPNLGTLILAEVAHTLL